MRELLLRLAEGILALAERILSLAERLALAEPERCLSARPLIENGGRRGEVGKSSYLIPQT